jgi:ankyrin repeat protein
MPPLGVAAVHGNAAMVEALLAHGADVNAKVSMEDEKDPHAKDMNGCGTHTHTHARTHTRSHS